MNGSETLPLALDIDALAPTAELARNILKLKGATGSAGADMAFLKKNIAENKESLLWKKRSAHER